MKRSDMLKLIVDSLIKDNRISKEQNAEDILSAIEKAGMLPPTYFGFGSFPINKWEAEKNEQEG